MSRLLPALLACALVLSPGRGRAVFFDSDSEWPANAGGWTVVKVCIVDGSEAGSGSLAQAITFLRRALAATWEAGTRLRFTGWLPCRAVPAGQAGDYAGLYLISDNTRVPHSPLPWGPASRGRHSTASFSILLNTWGRKMNPCSAGEARCIAEYGPHEFGHMLGYYHESQRPDRPAACQGSDIAIDHLLNLGDPWSPGPGGAVAIGPYDRSSLMSYDTDCTDFDPDTVRFGSAGLSPFDALGALTIYPAPATGAQDVGVLAAGVDCGAGEPITVYMDAEDDRPRTAATGWTGASRADRNAWLEFCRVDGARLGPATTPYSVLQLGPRCPAGARALTVVLDNEDDHNENYVSGLLSPGGQDRNTTLRLCHFAAAAGGAATLPDLGFGYGVFALAAMPGFGTGQTGTLVVHDGADDNADSMTVTGGGSVLGPDHRRAAAARIGRDPVLVRAGAVGGDPGGAGRALNRSAGGTAGTGRRRSSAPARWCAPDTGCACSRRCCTASSRCTPASSCRCRRPACARPR
ncbi:MAG: hypothetical protein R3F55_11220 [Alphaproteobacteria bacterium]